MRLAAAAQLQPLAQGELDGLCGLYSVINAVRLALQPYAPVSERQTERMFRIGADWLAAHALLDDAVSWGMAQGPWRRMAAAVLASASRRGLQLSLQPLLRDGRQRDAAFASIAAAIAQQQPVLVMLHEQLHHFTVISGIGPARLTLFDSAGYRYLARHTCSFRRLPTPTRHRIAPRALLALRVDAQP